VTDALERDYYRAQRDRWKSANAHCERALNALGEELTRVREERDQLVVERDAYGDEMRLLQRRVIFLEGVLAADDVKDFRALGERSLRPNTDET